MENIHLTPQAHKMNKEEFVSPKKSETMKTVFQKQQIIQLKLKLITAENVEILFWS